MDAMEPKRPPDDGSSEVSPKLMAALKGFVDRRVFIPPSTDTAILMAARQHLSRPKAARWRGLRPWLLWPGLATALAALLLLVYGLTQEIQTGRRHSTFAREDLNHDGRIDILDAFQLARQLQTGAPPSSSLDFNRDGVVDRRDADFIAAHAVQLRKGKRS